MKKLSLQNAKSMLSKKEMIKINGGYDGYESLQESGWGKIFGDATKAVGVEKLLEAVWEGAKEGAIYVNNQWKNAKQTEGTQTAHYANHGPY